MAKIIAFANQKGGVGKTTSAVNVAASLGLLGKKTLLVDLDPQGNATSGVGIPKRSLRGTVKEVLAGETDLKQVVLTTNYQNLSIVPTNVTLSGAEFDLYNDEGSEYNLKDAFKGVSADYDYIIIDCPPSLGMLTINAFVASDAILVPMQAEFYAVEGLSQLISTTKRIKKLYNENLQIVGILVTMYNKRLLLSMQVMDELQKYYPDKLFSTTISRNVKLSEAPGFGKPVYYHDKHSKGANEYLEVAKELISRI
ncbi:MAG: ParA family protein [Clostridia bacterium]|nr:ParA family protein [Clostridia bacterium]